MKRKFLSNYLLWASLGFYFLVVFFIASCNLKSSDSTTAAPETFEYVIPGNCAACHGGKRVLPPNHENTKKMETLDECNRCHENKKDGSEGKASGLRGNLHLSHIHLLRRVSCTDCHDKSRPESPLNTKDCLNCHDSYNELISLTLQVDPNPHDGHFGELDCDSCHHQHADSENFCNQSDCHNFSHVVP